MTTVKQVLKNTTPSSSATYLIDMKKRSDGRLPDKDTKPTTPTDKKIHNGHIVDSGQYNLRHLHDHGDELAFDYKRLAKEKSQEADTLQSQTLKVMNPIFQKMNLKLVRTNG